MQIDSRNYEALNPQKERRLRSFMHSEGFPAYLGMETLEIRRDYAAMRLRYKESLNQPIGFIHGGAIMGLMDTAAAWAILSGADLNSPPKRILTIDMHTQFLAAARKRDLIGYCVVRRRGRDIVYLSAETRDDRDRLLALASMVYMVK